VEFRRKKEKVLRVIMDKLYDILVQVGCLLIKNESSSRKSDIYYRFHEAMRYNIDECKEFSLEGDTNNDLWSVTNRRGKG
jgi:hypothetical protein